MAGEDVIKWLTVTPSHDRKEQTTALISQHLLVVSAGNYIKVIHEQLREHDSSIDYHIPVI